MSPKAGGSGNVETRAVSKNDLGEVTHLGFDALDITWRARELRAFPTRDRAAFEAAQAEEARHEEE